MEKEYICVCGCLFNFSKNDKCPSCDEEVEWSTNCEENRKLVLESGVKLFEYKGDDEE